MLPSKSFRIHFASSVEAMTSSSQGRKGTGGKPGQCTRPYVCYSTVMSLALWFVSAVPSIMLRENRIIHVRRIDFNNNLIYSASRSCFFYALLICTFHQLTGL